jgi:hypothetical protein
VPHPTGGAVLQRLKELISTPGLAKARELEDSLKKSGFRSEVFGRVNQRSSVEANSESDRGVVERLVNAFDASLTAARRVLGVSTSRDLTPRNAAQRFLCPNQQACEWSPTDPKIDWPQPSIQVWEEDPAQRHRYRKYQPDDGLVTVLIRDRGVGIERDRMPRTILDLNSDDKLRIFEAVGQYGHGGSSSLSFCESALVITQPRFGDRDQCYWTLIYPEPEHEASKQDLIRVWFAADDGLPLILDLRDYSEMRPYFPGTSVWHFGYFRGGWIRRITGPEQSNPWGRLGRLLFSYPLPATIEGKFARTDMENGHRTLTGAFFRMASDPQKLELAPAEKSEKLIVEGNEFGSFAVYVFVLKDKSNVRNYVDPRHPVILSLNGQNHGEMTSTIMTRANLPELSASTVIEVRLDGLEQEALGNIIANSREVPKNTDFTRALERRLVDVLMNDEALLEIERRRQEEKAKNSNAELNKEITAFIASIESDAVAEALPSGGGTAPGGGGGGGGKQRPEIPAADPPKILEFLSDKPILVSEGSTYLAKFKCDARPPRYSFHGDNPRMFAKLETSGSVADRLAVAGRGDINARGYGSVSLHCREVADAHIVESVDLGSLIVTLQSTDGRTLEARILVGVSPRPERKERRRKRSVSTQITFHAPDGDPTGDLARLLSEDKVGAFGTALDKFVEVVELSDKNLAAYWGERGNRDGVSVLMIEINAANSDLRTLLETCKTAEERVEAKKQYCRDVALDCYQHVFSLDDIPTEIGMALVEEQDAARAAEIFLNHDKAVRFARVERDDRRRRT